jgi:hypothetical protein
MKMLIRCLLIVMALAAARSNSTADHPRFFFARGDVPAMRARAEADTWLRDYYGALIRRANRLLATETSPYRAYGAGNGRGTTGRAAQQRIGALALAGYLAGEDRYFQKSRDILLAIVRQFTPYDRDVWGTHLQYSDATQALAIGYDLLHPFLTPAERAEVREEIRQYGHLLHTDDTVWGAPSIGVTSCNHNAVHFGALGLAALALGDEPAWLNRATERVRGYLQTFADETGYVLEGHDYLGYGQLGAVPFSLALGRSGGPDLLEENPVVRKIGDQLVWLLLPFDGAIRTLNDNPPHVPGPMAIAHALQHGSAVQLWAWLHANEPDMASRGDYGPSNGGFDDFLLFTPAGTVLQPRSPREAGWPLGRHYASGRVMLRSAWDEPDAAHVVFTSGYDRHQGHNHQDENAVSFAALGEDFLTDPGYWPDASECHTTLRINGVEQQVGSVGRVVAYREDAGGAFVRGQAPEAYPLIPGFVGHAERKLYFVRGPRPYLVWRDDAAGEMAGMTEVVARYVTRKANSVAARGDAAIITGGNGRASCLIAAYAEDQPVPVREDDLGGQSYVANSQTRVVYAEHFKRLSTTVTRPRVRLLTVVFPFREEAELPRTHVTFERSTDTLTCTLTFPSGRVDTLSFSATDARHRRASP